MRIAITLEVDIFEENTDDLCNNIHSDITATLKEALHEQLDDECYSFDPNTISTEVHIA